MSAITKYFEIHAAYLDSIKELAQGLKPGPRANFIRAHVLSAETSMALHSAEREVQEFREKNATTEQIVAHLRACALLVDAGEFRDGYQLAADLIEAEAAAS